jgi:hypothetical protein
MNTNLAQTVFAVLLLVMLAALTDPFMYWMPSMPQMVALALATALLAGWMGFVAREKALDEREAEHRMFAGRAAYLSGLAVLTTALLMQGFAQAIDPWVPGALATMVVSKLAARWYADTFR